MIRFLRWLIFGDAHRHHWKIIKEEAVYDGRDMDVPLHRRYTQQCTICGKIKATNAK